MWNNKFQKKFVKVYYFKCFHAFEDTGENFKWTTGHLNNLSKLSVAIDSHIQKAIKTSHPLEFLKNKNTVSFEISKNIYDHSSIIAVGVKISFQMKSKLTMRQVNADCRVKVKLSLYRPRRGWIGINCFRLLEHCDCGFEFHSRHGSLVLCMRLFCVVLCCVLVAALGRADHSSKESNHQCKKHYGTEEEVSDEQRVVEPLMNKWTPTLAWRVSYFLRFVSWEIPDNAGIQFKSIMRVHIHITFHII
jgi:hypothetical protein